MNINIKSPNTATAYITGDSNHPELHGNVFFRSTDKGVMVTARIYGLPEGEDCMSEIFGFHIHEGSECSGTYEDAFANTKGHYNPEKCPHPSHAGDLPPLFGNSGYAYMSVLTNRFKISDIIGKTVVIHSNADDFITQPSGNSGNKIACGEIF